MLLQVVAFTQRGDGPAARSCWPTQGARSQDRVGLWLENDPLAVVLRMGAVGGPRGVPGDQTGGATGTGEMVGLEHRGPWGAWSLGSCLAFCHSERAEDKCAVCPWGPTEGGALQWDCHPVPVPVLQPMAGSDPWWWPACRCSPPRVRPSLALGCWGRDVRGAGCEGGRMRGPGCWHAGGPDAGAGMLGGR